MQRVFLKIKKSKIMKVVILAGGMGRRISDTFTNVPKPMMKIGDFPILWHIMNIYIKYGFNDFIICAGYLHQSIKEFFLNYNQLSSDIEINLNKTNSINFIKKKNSFNCNVKIINTGLNSGTSFRLSSISEYIDKRFFLTYGDGLSDINISDLVKHHLANKKISTVTCVKPPARFGNLVIKDNLVTSFKEKESYHTYINGGFFVLEPEIFHYLNKNDQNEMFENQPLNNIAKDNQLSAYIHNGQWQCMDTPNDNLILNQLWSSGKAFWI